MYGTSTQPAMLAIGMLISPLEPQVFLYCAYFLPKIMDGFRIHSYEELRRSDQIVLHQYVSKLLLKDFILLL